MALRSGDHRKDREKLNNTVHKEWCSVAINFWGFHGNISTLSLDLSRKAHVYCLVSVGSLRQTIQVTVDISYC